MPLRIALSILFFGLLAAGPLRAEDGNRLTYLDEFCDPYYAHRDFPKLVTPQWVGDEGVEAVVTLGIDDMRDPQVYENYLRPILTRLQKIDGRAPVSIMTNVVDPAHPQLQTWLKEGVSIETHTAAHPCPCLQGGDLAAVKHTYDACVDQMSAIPGSRPVAFRFPCMDSQNTPSPRAFVEIFNRTTPEGNFLEISTSVCVLLTPDDPALPRELVANEKGESRFAKYIPFPSFVNKIENYPYPFVISRLCWEFPCTIPDDWQGHNLQQSANPGTVEDWKAAIDATVVKQGVANLVFHPHGWVLANQMVDIVDHVDTKHGKGVKFLTFAECAERLNKNLLAGQPLRNEQGGDNGVRLLDLDADGYLDVVIGNPSLRQTRLWNAEQGKWVDSDLPVELVAQSDAGLVDAGVRFGILRRDGRASMMAPTANGYQIWHFTQQGWQADDRMTKGLDLEEATLASAATSSDPGVRLRDLDGDGICEFVVSNPQQNAVFAWSDNDDKWAKLEAALPEGATIVDSEGRDAGLRFVDVDEEGHADVMFSNHERYSLHLYDAEKRDFSRVALAGQRGGAEPGIPMISRLGTNNGAWFARNHLWLQNEDTARLPDGIDRRSFTDLLANLPPAPLSPEQALKSMTVRPGMTVEIAAAEPLTMDPVAFDWGADGKLWVVEMTDYPLGVDGKPAGRVRYLEDQDGDGRYDRSTLFLTGLNYPTGVSAWRDGVLVLAPPELFYAADTDGDGKADKREVLFDGFGEGNQQHRANGLRRGLDNWLYIANGDSGGEIRSVKTGETVSIAGRDLRVRPDDGSLDPQAGQTQYGRDRDDWGNWFGCNNSQPQWHYVLADHYMRRNAHSAAPDPRKQVSVTPGTAQIYPTSKTVTRFNEPGSANRFTSANSTMIYRDELLGEEFYGNSFVSEPVHNLVHREIVSPEGATFTSRRADDEQTSEFLSSSDNWFRPTSIRTGPDGALWISDMYRMVIEHPEWIPDDWEARLDLRAGHDRGRIYRVYPKGKKPRKMVRLDKLSTEQLVAALDSSNGWQRDMAQQVLIWKRDAAAVRPLEKLATTSKRPLARLHALCTLDGLGKLSDGTLLAALNDSDAGVRRHAVRLAESRLDVNESLLEAVLKHAEGDDPQVVLQTAYSLGQTGDPRAAVGLARLLMRHNGDGYLRAATLSSLRPDNIAVVVSKVAAADERPETLLGELVTMMGAMGDQDTLATALATIADGDSFEPWRLEALSATLRELERRQLALDAVADDKLQERIARMLDQARSVVADEQAPQAQRIAALRTLGTQPSRREDDLASLEALLTPQTDLEIQSAAIEQLARLGGEDATRVLLAGWDSYGPALRGLALDALLASEGSVSNLLAALEGGDIRAEQLDATRRQQLLSHPNAELRARAEPLLAGPSGSSRAELVEQFADLLALESSAERGAIVFNQKCAVCHRLNDVGHVVGPDLAALTDKSPRSLLVAILDPNRAVEDKFVNYNALDADGRQHTGMLQSETGNSITLIGQEAKQQSLLRRELEMLQSTGKSLMPEGLEKDLTRQQIADVIAYVGRTSGPPKMLEGNAPTLVTADGEGELKLAAAQAHVYGSTLTFETTYGNLGYWASSDDHAIWRLNVPTPGKYLVSLDYALTNDYAGNRLGLVTSGGELTHTIQGTDGWDSYRQVELGEVELPAGEQTVIARPQGELRGALLDLRTIRLTPVK